MTSLTRVSFSPRRRRAKRRVQTPVDAEAAEFLADESSQLFWSFIEAYKPPAESTDKAQLEAVEKVAAGLLSPLGLRLLRSFLSAHVFSPRVQLWRQLASTAQEEHGLKGTDGWVAACGKVRPLGDAPAAAAAAPGGRPAMEGGGRWSVDVGSGWKRAAPPRGCQRPP